MNRTLEAASPLHNAVVAASAGTGKTWLLVTRIVRLLLHGARPDGILAVTFTRKAAGEMQTRLNERLRALVDLDDGALDVELESLGIEPNGTLREQARRLYETLLFCERPVRITTFHALCQDILRRFPLEADVAPNFELLEATGALQDAAWDALFAEATVQPDGPVAQALETLFDRCASLHGTRQALNAFLDHRSDWWAYTEGAAEPVRQAETALADLLAIDPGVDYTAAFFTPGIRGELQRYARRLRQHATQTYLGHAAQIEHALDEDLTAEQRFSAVKEALLTQKGEPRRYKESNAQAKTMGQEGQSEFLALHASLCQAILQTGDHLARCATFTVSHAWYRAGTRYVEHFQRLKLEQRCLDFTDLEWKACRLLNHADNALWVQYKLDQRIDHLLIDEFQDTNPTQWRLVLPLLQELAAGGTERARSVFLVGDDKQSIYRFRRADPRLLQSAGDWLRAHLGARVYTLDASRRSAPAVIELINRVFSNPPLGDLLPSFHIHDTHRTDLWGRVELLPLIEPAVEAGERVAPQALRNPLQTPRPSEENRRHYLEGQAIARRIRALIDQRTLVGPDGAAVPLDYNGVVILLRRRTHAQAYEQALREAGIPFLGADRGTLLESLEVRDLEALLEILITPYDNLALAQVLRSPLFAVSDGDLMRLAAIAGPGSWMERLERLAAELPADATLARAWRALSRWRAQAGHIPVHDLLDRIYSEADVLARYQAAFPPALRPRVRAHLTRFIELALEVDSGRYPSLVHFLSRLRELRTYEQQAPGETPAADGASEARVRLMTIHAAKGLEAPVVFLADAAATPAGRTQAFQALIDWPADAARPASFLLAGRKSGLDSVSRRLLEVQVQAEAREETNLLYVALTRAQQVLIVSGCAPARGSNLGGYGLIAAAAQDAMNLQPDGIRVLESGRPPRPQAGRPTQSATPAPAPDPRLSRPLAPVRDAREITPSETADDGEIRAGGDPQGRRRGTAIHRMLELLSAHRAQERDGLLRQVAGEFALDPDDAELAQWWQEALRVVNDPALVALFDPARYDAAYNEVPISYRHGSRWVHGVIDRLVLREDTVTLIDYKTHRQADPENLAPLAEPHREQLRLYAQGVRALWPGRRVRPVLLFTVCARAFEITLEVNA
ncbi:MAG: UvrD-helicase domain-containing protein [Gammaproteobacteria bacterium]|nr:UvrD-helicase domain-containing protein [Gammaproteobacteria bacterium]